MFLFIAYKPSSEEHCGTWIHYSSDHEVVNSLDPQNLVDTWAKYLYRNKNLDCNEVGYEFYIFKNNVMLFEKNTVGWTSDEQRNAEYKLVFNLWQKAKELADNLQAEQETKKLQELFLQVSLKDREAKEKRRMEYEKLKQAIATKWCRTKM